jgi:hypothetical protein
MYSYSRCLFMPPNKLFSGLAFWLLTLLLPEPDLAFYAAYPLGVARSAAIRVRRSFIKHLLKSE